MTPETCIHGHPKTPANVYVSPKGYTSCRVCRRIGQKRRLQNPIAAEKNRRAMAAVRAAGWEVAKNHPEEFAEALDRQRVARGLPPIGESKHGRPRGRKNNPALSEGGGRE